MTVILKQIFNLIKLLHSETGANQIAWGVSMGFILGMTPSLSLQSILVFTLLFLFRIQIGAAFMTAAFFKLVAFILDPAFHSVGVAVLELEGLAPVFTELYNMPIVPWTRFYNTVVMGSGVVAIAFAPFIYMMAKTMTQKYRTTVVAYVEGTKYWKYFKATAFYKWYVSYDNLYGEA